MPAFLLQTLVFLLPGLLVYALTRLLRLPVLTYSTPLSIQSALWGTGAIIAG